MTRATNAATQAILEMLDGGFLQLYNGQTLLAQMRFATPAFGDVEDGFALAYDLMVGTGRADGIAEKWVALSETGVPVLAGDVGDDMLLNQRYIATGADVRITRFSYQQAAG
jgi:hypothetical protein